jgi:ubiquinone biosynthesis protein
MWKTADPVVREWIARNLGPVGRLEDAAEGAGEIGKFLAQVPGLLTRAGHLADQIDAATRDGIVLSPDTIEAIAQAERRQDRPQLVALWVIAVLLAILIYLVL